LLERKATRLVADDPDYLDLVRMQMSFVDQMRRIYTLAKRIAKVVAATGNCSEGLSQRRLDQ
jgi:hypothetical protein